jgi:hypothetical protein
MPITLLTTSAKVLTKLIESYCLELLARGVFPHGLEGGNDILEIGEVFVPSIDCKFILKEYVKLFPLLPVPPIPMALQRAPNLYFDPPKSDRAILAEGRAEEERIQQEQARLAAETHTAKNLAQLEQGRQTLNKFQDEEEDDEEEEGGKKGSKSSKKKDSGTKKKSRRRGTEQDTLEITEKILMSSIMSAVCGVSSKDSIVKIDIPPPPIRGRGMRINNSSRDAHSENPLDLSRTSLIPAPPVPQLCITSINFMNQNDQNKYNNAYFPLFVDWPERVYTYTPVTIDEELRVAHEALSKDQSEMYWRSTLVDISNSESKALPSHNIGNSFMDNNIDEDDNSENSNFRLSNEQVEADAEMVVDNEKADDNSDDDEE